jgi:hypothetical protein
MKSSSLKKNLESHTRKNKQKQQKIKNSDEQKNHRYFFSFVNHRNATTEPSSSSSATRPVQITGQQYKDDPSQAGKDF